MGVPERDIVQAKDFVPLRPSRAPPQGELSM